VSIVRVGLAETKKFSEGYEVIFGKKGATEGRAAPTAAKKAAGAKKAPAKKKTPAKKAPAKKPVKKK
jgi:hypothetical protein